MPDPVALATTISDGVLFPGALEVDASDIVPVDRLDRLASAGFYGLAGPAEAGGMGVADMATALKAIEIIASGCLTTAFVWIQHHGPSARSLTHRKPSTTPGSGGSVRVRCEPASPSPGFAGRARRSWPLPGTATAGAFRGLLRG